MHIPQPDKELSFQVPEKDRDAPSSPSPQGFVFWKPKKEGGECSAVLSPQKDLTLQISKHRTKQGHSLLRVTYCVYYSTKYIRGATYNYKKVKKKNRRYSSTLFSMEIYLLTRQLFPALNVLVIGRRYALMCGMLTHANPASLLFAEEHMVTHIRAILSAVL